MQGKWAVFDVTAQHQCALVYSPQPHKQAIVTALLGKGDLLVVISRIVKAATRPGRGSVVLLELDVIVAAVGLTYCFGAVLRLV